MTDIALDPYTTTGTTASSSADGSDVDNDRTVAILAKMAVLHASAGVDLVAPSDMMDGRVGAIRRALDAADREGTAIMAYTAKYASAYYGPFRDAVGSAKASGTRSLDKRDYQLNPANRREAVTELRLDEAEGADIVMVKPAGLYLDIIRELRFATRKPIAAYQVSGEYSQIHAAARLGWLDLAQCRRESLVAIKRAGARHDPDVLRQGRRRRAERLGSASERRAGHLDRVARLELRVLGRALLGELDVHVVEDLVADDAHLILLGIEREPPCRLRRPWRRSGRASR